MIKKDSENEKEVLLMDQEQLLQMALPLLGGQENISRTTVWRERP